MQCRSRVSMIVCMVAAASVWAVAQPKAPAASQPFKPALEVQQMMEGQDLLFDNIKKAMVAGKFDEAKVQAWLLSELGNVNVRHAKEQRYAEFAEKMSRASMELANTLRKRNLDQSKTAYTAVNTSCKNCHDVYKKD